MVKKANIQEVIQIPTDLSHNARIELGKRIIEEVRERTERGVDKSGKRFPSYNKDYDKSGTPDIHRTGDTLIELDVLNINRSTITIGYELGHELAGQVEGNVIGSYGQPTGNPKKARDYIGLPQSVVNRIVEEIKQDPQFQEERAGRESIIGSILNRIGR